MADEEAPDFSRDETPSPKGDQVDRDRSPRRQERVDKSSVKTTGDKACSAGDKLPGLPPTEGNQTGSSTDKRVWVPLRVEKALQESTTFDEFRKARKFRFLHLFSGEVDQSATAVKVEAERNRLEVYVESLDRKEDKELDLTDPKIFDGIDASVESGEWDWIRSGFPCSSFSRVRWREAPGKAPPVRSKQFIYGLPGNPPHLQKEADAGTVMATRSGWIHKQVDASRRRGVPETSTLENPKRVGVHGISPNLNRWSRRQSPRRWNSIHVHTCLQEKDGISPPSG